MSRLLSGLELQGFIKERQAKQVRNLRQEHGIVPKLRIIMSEHASRAITTYVRMKVAYADDVLIEVEVAPMAQYLMPEAIMRANRDESIHGVIIQLPLDDTAQTDELCNMIAPEKDVDGLGKRAAFPSATAEAIDWLLAGYNIDLEGKHIVLLGHGKLVGGPLARMWKERGYLVTILDERSEQKDEALLQAEVIVAATGVPHILHANQVATGTVVVDAGTASEGGVLVGDVDDSVRERSDVTITPTKGGVGPLTYTLLFDHVIQAALKVAGKL